MKIILNKAYKSNNDLHKLLQKKITKLTLEAFLPKYSEMLNYHFITGEFKFENDEPKCTILEWSDKSKTYICDYTDKTEYCKSNILEKRIELKLCGIKCHDMFDNVFNDIEFIIILNFYNNEDVRALIKHHNFDRLWNYRISNKYIANKFRYKNETYREQHCIDDFVKKNYYSLYKNCVPVSETFIKTKPYKSHLSIINFIPNKVTCSGIIYDHKTGRNHIKISINGKTSVHTFPYDTKILVFLNYWEDINDEWVSILYKLWDSHVVNYFTNEFDYAYFSSTHFGLKSGLMINKIKKIKQRNSDYQNKENNEKKIYSS